MKKFLLGLVFIGSIAFLRAQEDVVIMTINEEPVYKYEFEQIFWKNKKENTATKEDLDEYLDLFTKFKMKVAEAEELGLDTVTKFKKELNGYKVQLQKPYLVDSKVNEELIQEAYARMKTEVKASHILLLLDASSTAADTVKVYNRIKAIRDEITSGKISFEDAARKYSEDKSVTNNGGDLGYFSAFRMVYRFETTAYETEIGQISQPVRTRFGYHLVKTTDKRPGRGQVRVAHIMLVAKGDASVQDQKNAEKKINEIYSKIMNGASFEEMAREFSEDRQSAANGGALKWIKSGETFPEFDSTAFALKKDGDISKPIKTQSGWHIIKRLEYQPIGDLEGMRNELKKKIQRDVRSQKSKNSFIDKLKKEYNYTENTKLLKHLRKLMDSSIVDGRWKYESNKKMEKVIVSYANEKIKLDDLARHIEKSQRPLAEGSSIDRMLALKLDHLVETKIVNYEKSQLESKYPDYRALLKEYRDGILLFEITDQKVWGKGVKDTTGLQTFYNEHKADFMWPDRVKAKIFSSDKKEIIEKAFQLFEEGKIRVDSIINYSNRDSQLNLKYEEGTFAREENEWIDKGDWRKGLNSIKEFDGKFVFVFVEEELPREPKKLDEAKGIITAAYQDYLEKVWMEALKNKYKVDVNKEVLYSIKHKPE